MFLRVTIFRTSVLRRFQIKEIGSRGGNPLTGRARGLNSKLHLAVDLRGMPMSLGRREGRMADCTQAGTFIVDIAAEHLLALRGYDSDAIVAEAQV